MRWAGSFTPAGETRSERRTRERAVAAAARADVSTSEGPVGRARAVLPAPASPGPFAAHTTAPGYWNPIGLNAPAHRSTSPHIAGIYPFVADPGIGQRGPIIGADLNADALWHFSPFDAYADGSDRAVMTTNIAVFGKYRSGKSSTIKTMAVRSIPFGYFSVIPSDSKGEWVPVARAVGGTVIRLGGGSKNRLNPLNRGPRRADVTDEQDAEMVRDRRSAVLFALVDHTLGGARSLRSDEVNALEQALSAAIAATDDQPTLRTVLDQLEQMTDDGLWSDPDLVTGAREPRFVLRRFVHGDLAGLFEDESTVEFDEDSPMVVVDTSELFARGELVAQLASTCTSAWIQSVISDRSAKRRRYLIREEGWRDMASVPQLRTFQQWMKLSRHYGVSNILILHSLSDLDAVGEAGSKERALAHAILGDIENKFLFRMNRQEWGNLRTRLLMPESHVQQLRSLPKGRFLAYVGEYAYIVDCFATSTAWEYELFKTDDAVTGEDSDIDDFDVPVDEVWPDVDDDVDAWLVAGS
ncbi:hypothetical protein [Microbacterium sp. SLBN-111]|uniref:hypothetical protein n=1 Tax=Microbacterium sp. SLBN-111 TaxID=3377733 RepID=UPI003C772A9F